MKITDSDLMCQLLKRVYVLFNIYVYMYMYGMFGGSDEVKARTPCLLGNYYPLVFPSPCIYF